MENRRYLTVHSLTKYIKRKFDADPHLTDVFVKGEISNFKQHSSGHMYFTLKDEKARMLAVMFASSAKGMKFIPENGMNVLVRGSISVYEASGQYQIYVKEMQPDGIGALYLAYEQLKEKLEKEGLFHPSRKKMLPIYPQTIGIITSPTGAAIRDIITTIRRRYPIGKVLLIPALVQGQQASTSIARAIQQANSRADIDVLIVGRGGGSIEELWAFNEEIVARAIYESSIPIVSAVGHETDFTIADLVADVRAATPTAAAEIAVPHIEELLERLMNRKMRIFRSMSQLTKEKRNKLKALDQSYMMRNPQKLYEQKWERLDRLSERLYVGQTTIFKERRERYIQLNRSLRRYHPANTLRLSVERYNQTKRRLVLEARKRLKDKSQAFIGKVATLEALSPLSTLQRGFSIAHDQEGKIVKNVDQVRPGETMKLIVTDGKISCTINQIEKGEQNE
ncbi:exodeoxyribonuclease VII large subunit [Bacillus sp. FJAT-50079]|uniref:exodeoxyribonuclease VII large subunit n=1 Tax=Bacillus sp. FJAT-50079 TaxID=2833577 RepID=UPI001BCA0CCA|nr:exodeoxyribonuclease VII large subunit [Bacillus sp. FJAT-50079]MBS4209645.1 exodeoxyribonuclease VII large subunit [Bacillus sp. FJAT-50079]